MSGRIAIFAVSLGMLVCVSGPARAEEFRISEEARKHWAFQPVRNVEPPTVSGAGDAASAVDRFLLAKLLAAGLKPAEPADRRTLIRRATFDLTGLPPTPEEVDAFVADTSPGAFAKVIDRLLASKAYGEKWGRHWLDVVRYADTAGDNADFPVREAYKYRNWVIDAFNADMPYDAFLRDQVAGDIFAAEGPKEQYRNRVIATGFLALTKRYSFDLMDTNRDLDLADTIDVVGRSVLGLSVGCARCHDHKFEPLSMADYYGLYGIFDSTQYAFPGAENLPRPGRYVALIPPAERKPLDEAHNKSLAEADAKLKAASAERDVILAHADGVGGSDLAFELQTEGGVRAPWEFIGPRVAATLDAQSPFTNVYPAGTRGVRIASEPASERLGVRQNIVPRRKPTTTKTLHFNIDFRTGGDAAADGRSYRMVLGQRQLMSTAVELRIFKDQLRISNGDRLESIRTLTPGTWHNLQLCINLEKRTYTGSIGRPGDWANISERAFWPLWVGELDVLLIDTLGDVAPGATPALDVDNVAVADDKPFATALTTEFHRSNDDRHAAGRARLTDVLAVIPKLKTARDAIELYPPYEVAYGVAERETPGNAKILKRGDSKTPGNETPRRFLEILGGDTLPATEKGSGRRELAEWLTRPSNPLTARVIVNRVWQWHFGSGIVRTPSDFGVRGERPTHPELLDHLASHFVADGWSIKRLHRRLMLTNAYQMSSEPADTASVEADPDARWLSRFPRRRLLAEEFRDAMLAVAGTLDREIGGEFPFPAVETWNFQTGQEFDAVYPSNQRSVYLMVSRFKPRPFFGLFDAADPNVSTESRPETITAKQALYLMNDPFVHEQTTALATRLSNLADATRLQSIWRLAFGRAPSLDDVAEAETFLNAYRQAAQPQASAKSRDAQLDAWAAYARALLTSNEFLYVD